MCAVRRLSNLTVWLLSVVTIMAASPTQVSGNPSNKVVQVIQLRGSEVAKVTSGGEIWIGGDKAGEITSKGEIWVAGDKQGDLTKDGEVWKAGNQVGDITSDGEVWREGDRVGTVEKDGTIWVGSSREGHFKGGRPAHAAVIVFYGFFELDD